MRHVENHLESAIQGIVKRCRNASSTRVMTRKVRTKLEHIESAYNLACSGYLKAPDAKALIEQTLTNLANLEEVIGERNPYDDESTKELTQLKAKLEQFQPRRGRPRMGKVRSRDIATYQRIFNALTEHCPTPTVAKDIIEGVIEYTK